MSPGPIEIKERYVPNLNESYNGKEEQEMDLRFSEDAGNVGDDSVAISTAYRRLKLSAFSLPFQHLLPSPFPPQLKWLPFSPPLPYLIHPHLSCHI